MGINKESEISANLQIGPTSMGMVRIYVEGDGIELPLDFEPDEALEIAEEIRLAAERAREMQDSAPRGRKGAGDPARQKDPAGQRKGGAAPKGPGGKSQRG